MTCLAIARLELNDRATERPAARRCARWRGVGDRGGGLVDAREAAVAESRAWVEEELERRFIASYYNTLHHTTSHWIGLRWIGLDWIGLDWIRLGWI